MFGKSCDICDILRARLVTFLFCFYFTFLITVHKKGHLVIVSIFYILPTFQLLGPNSKQKIHVFVLFLKTESTRRSLGLMRFRHQTLLEAKNNQIIKKYSKVKISLIFLLQRTNCESTLNIVYLEHNISILSV